MRIWINTPFDTVPGEGGPPMRYWLLARALVAAGHEVTLWSSDFHHVTKSRRKVEPVYQAEGFQVRLVPTLAYQSNVGLKRMLSHKLYARRWRKLALAAVNAKELQPPDLILVSLPPLELYAMAHGMRNRWGCRIVVDVQDAWPENFHRLLPKALLGLAPLIFWLAHRQARRAYRGADAVTAVAARYLQLAKDAGCQNPTAHFPLGCQVSSISLADDDDLEADRPLELCYIGNLGDQYDIQTMIDGMRQLISQGCRLSLSVAGDGPQRGRIEDAIKAGLPIRYLGYLKADELAACMAACDVGVVPMFPASWVVVPNKVMDYAAAGMAVLNGLTGESQDLLERYHAGVSYEVGDVQSFVRAVRLYVDDRDLLVRHRRGARALAEAEFDGEQIYARMAAWVAERAR